MTRATVSKIFEALNSGKTMNTIVNGRVGNHRVCSSITTSGKLRVLKIKHPDIGRRIEVLAKRNAVAAREKGYGNRRLVASHLLTASAGETAFAAIAAATAHLPDFLRDDVRSAMFLAAAEGRLNPRDAATRLREFTVKQNRLFSKFLPGSGIMQSLDQQVYDDGPTRLVDTVTRGLWD